MKKSKRILSLSLTIIAFFTITPIVVLYALGYRIIPPSQTQSGLPEIEQVGLILIRTQPNNTDIYLDDKFVDTEDVIRIRNISPGTHDLRIEKSGYRPYQKTITVLPERVTHLEYIRLFPVLPQTENPTGEAPTIALSESTEFIVAATQNIITIINKDNARIKNQITITNPDLITNETNTSLFVSDKNIILKTDNAIGLSTTTAESITLIPSESLLEPTKAIFTAEHLYTSNDIENAVYAQTNKQISLINWDQNTSTKISENATGISDLSDQLLLTTPTQLLSLNSPTDPEPTELSAFQTPLTSPSTILTDPRQSHIAVKSGDGNLYYIGEQEFPHNITTTATTAEWSRRTRNHPTQLLYGNNNEISIYTPSTNSTQTLTRTTSQLKSPHWLNPELPTYITLISDNTVHALENTTFSQKQFHALTSLNNNFPILPADDGNTLIGVNENTNLLTAYSLE